MLDLFALFRKLGVALGIFVRVTIPGVLSLAGWNVQAAEIPGARAVAMLECALLAGTLEASDSRHDRYADLTSAGIDAALAAIHELRADGSFDRTLGPVGPALTGQSDSFFAGMLFATTARKIEAELDDQVGVIPGATLEKLKQQRAAAAGIEYEHRNCALIGREDSR